MTIALYIHFSVIYEEEGTRKLVDALLQFVERLSIYVVLDLGNQFLLLHLAENIEGGGIFLHAALALGGDALDDAGVLRELGKVCK